MVLGYKKDQTKTEPAFDTPPDATGIDGALQYPNFTSQRTRSGHSITLDDSKGAESVTIKHRSGSMVQFLPDGAIHFVSHNGQYTTVFGENRMTITGAFDVVVQGGGSLQVNGDYNTTILGNHNTVVNGDMNITAKNMNTVVRGNMDTSAQNMTTKISGSTEITTEGVTAISSDGGLSLASTGAGTSIISKGDLGIGTTGTLMLESEAGTNIKSGAALRASATGKLSLTAGGYVAADGSKIYLNSGESEEAASMSVNMPVPNNPNPATGGSA